MSKEEKTINLGNKNAMWPKKHYFVGYESKYINGVIKKGSLIAFVDKDMCVTDAYSGIEKAISKEHFNDNIDAFVITAFNGI